MNLRIAGLITILLAIDFYVFFGLRFIFGQRETSIRIFTWIYWIITATSLLVILAGFFSDWRSWPKFLRMYSFSFVIITYLTKMLMSLFLVLDDVIRLFRWSGTSLLNRFSSGGKDQDFQVSRLDFLVKSGALLSAVPMVSLLYGMTGNAYRHRVRRVKLTFPDLPPAFEGFKAVQISDLHTGSFLSDAPLRKAIDLIHRQQPDVIFFTGDLVNDKHDEALEYKHLLDTLKAPHGVYSILGNHDYGDYYKWNTIEEKELNLQQMKNLHRELGWNLLLNDSAYLEKDGHRIGLIGVENWSARMNFKRYGDMKKAVHQFDPAPVNILLSHDPSHWHAEITSDYPFVDLTLSGHTHGFQFGVEIPGFRWSPVQYVYKEWADLYSTGKQYMYVNRGLGFIGYPGRVGILPEITVFEFTRA